MRHIGQVACLIWLIQGMKVDSLDAWNCVHMRPMADVLSYDDTSGKLWQKLAEFGLKRVHPAKQRRITKA